MQNDSKIDNLPTVLTTIQVEIQHVWTCPTCRSINEIENYDLGEYLCGSCKQLVLVTQKSIKLS